MFLKLCRVFTGGVTNNVYYSKCFLNSFINYVMRFGRKITFLGNTNTIQKQGQNKLFYS